MPRPPPPATAFTKSGYGSADGRLDERVDVGRRLDAGAASGTPAALAAAIARALLPVSSSTSAVGPMKVMPALAQASARAGFSERKP